MSVSVPIQDHPLFLLPCVAVLGLLLWRIGKFTILPMFYRRDPKELPYWIPGKYACLSQEWRTDAETQSLVATIYIISFVPVTIDEF